MVKYTKKEKIDDRDKYAFPFGDSELISKMILEKPIKKHEENKKKTCKKEISLADGFMR